MSLDLDSLRARGISHLPAGGITNLLRRLLWPLNRPYYAALIEALGSAGDIPRRATMPGHDLDALRKDVLAIAHRLASLEDRDAGALPAPPAAPGRPAPADAARSDVSFSRCGEDRIVDHLLRAAWAPPAIRYADVGAVDPARSGDTLLFHRQGGSGVLLLADPAQAEACRAARPGDLVASLGQEPGQAIGHALEHWGDATTLHLLALDPGAMAALPHLALDRLRPWVVLLPAAGAGTGTPPDVASGALAAGYVRAATTPLSHVLVRPEILARGGA